MLVMLEIRMWWERRQERKASRRRARMLGTVPPSTLEAIQRRLAEDDWADVRRPQR